MDKKKRNKLMWTITIGLLVVFFVVSVVQLIFLFNIKKKQTELQRELDANNAYIAEKEKDLEYVKSNEYLEDWAREHGYVKE